MTLNKMDFKQRYVSNRDNLLDDFYRPVIENSKIYKRMTGYFSSSFIDELYKEIRFGIDNNNLKIYLICSPELSFQDKQDIIRGLDYKDIIEKHLIEDWESLLNEEAEKISIISRLIIEGSIEFKFVIDKNGDGIFHAKDGIFIDNNNYKIAFTGSNNETYSAVKRNFETTIVFKDETEIIDDIDNTFNEIWFENNDSLCVYDIREELMDFIKNSTIKRTIPSYKKITDIFNLYDYQEEAIQSWVDNNYIGLLEMATGTGKTITALGCYERLRQKEDNIATFIVVPQLDLVNQWYEEIELLGLNIIKCSSTEKNWERSLKLYLRRNDNKIPTIVITTQQTFTTPRFQGILKNYLNQKALLISDEVHGFGSTQTTQIFGDIEEFFEYRLGVSATPFRRDETETAKLIGLFSKITFQYSLKDAINNGFLNQYNYKPLILYFGDDELHKYRTDMKGNLESPGSFDGRKLKEIENVTTSVLNASIGKVNKLTSLIKKTGISDPKIVYCSPGEYNDGRERKDERHVDYVGRVLGDIGCRLRKVYSIIPTNERSDILEQFKSKELDTLLAIKCLDQGVNLKSVTHAFILSSTDSLTEFVQRRGRILRVEEGKPISMIYDLVMLPEDISMGNSSPKIEDAYLVKRELRRMKEFNQASSNKEENEILIENIEDIYKGVIEEYETRTKNY